MPANPLESITSSDDVTSVADSVTEHIDGLLPDDGVSSAVSTLGSSAVTKAVAGPALSFAWGLVRRHPKLAVMLVLAGAVGFLVYKRNQADDPTDSRPVVDDIPNIDRRQPA